MSEQRIQCYTADGRYWALSDILERTRSYPRTRLMLTALERSYRTTTCDEHKGSPEFRARALRSDLRYPILVARGPRGGLHIIDGRHRIWKARHLGHTSISARVFPMGDLQNIPHGVYEEDYVVFPI